MFLQHPQQPHLERRGDIADFVQEQGAALRRGETPGLVLVRAGKGPGLVAEQFTFQERVGQGAAVDGDKGTFGAPAHAVDGASQQFLAGAGLALDQDAAVAGRDLGEHVEKTAHQIAAADHVPDLKTSGDFLAQFFHQAQVAESFRAADDLAFRVAQQRRRHRNRDALSTRVYDVTGTIDDALARVHGMFQGAVHFTHARPEHFPAALAQRLLPGNSRDLFRRAIKRSHLPGLIHGEDTVGDAFENAVRDIGLICFHYKFRDRLEINASCVVILALRWFYGVVFRGLFGLGAAFPRTDRTV
ncbi:MAG: hypothetical protein BWY09_00450 [Candidatus Hydrogenedentes bacterium ADurb.Bin179]|nr:MAG: hypothetical protein BWY09_00450 [Candidatus Hydrogenedentes bacterium ADurb.Bin179]